MLINHVIWPDFYDHVIGSGHPCSKVVSED